MSDAPGAPVGGRAAAWLARAGRAVAADLGRRLLAESDRWSLWLPVALGAGVALYYALLQEPPALASAGGLALGGGVILLGRRYRAALGLGGLLLAGAIGFGAAQLHTAVMAAPMLSRDLGPVGITGRVVGLEALPAGARVVLGELTIPRLAPAETPDRVRLRLPAWCPVPEPGAMIRLTVMLRRPPAPAAPGAYDFQRSAFFDGIGGTGWAVGRPQVVTGPAPTWLTAWGVQLEALRQEIARRVNQVVPPPAAAVTAALLNGSQIAIDAATMNDYRVSGLAHLLSISGLHIALVAGLVFFVVRAGLALIEPLALRYPIKKWAAVAALLASLGYMTVVGSPAPTLRSVLMHGLVMVAILLDRDPISLRLCGVAAVVVLLLRPDSLLGPSFQMSFGAVIALIATYETLQGRLTAWWRERGPLGGAGLWLAGSILTSTVATLAILPFSLYHFQQTSFYGVFANMLAVPLTSFWVMPWALVAYVLLPLGLEPLALVPMGWGVAGINWIAHVTAELPGASLLVPAMPWGGLVLTVLGGLWLLLWRGSWRWWGLAALAAGFLTIPLAPRPDLLVGAEGQLLAVRGAGGGLLLSAGRGDRFTSDSWLHRDGAAAAEGRFPRRGASADGRLACDARGCVYRLRGQAIAWVRDPEALPEDCRRAQVVIAPEPARRCRAPLVIDRRILRREGAHALYLAADGTVTVDTVRARRGDRPWTGPPEPVSRPVSRGAAEPAAADLSP